MKESNKPSTPKEYESCIDAEDGLSRFMGDSNFYISLLDSFMKESDSTIKYIQKLYLNDDNGQIMAELHGLKGSSRNLSLRLFSKTLEDLEHKAGTQELTENDIQLLIEHYKNTEECINRFKLEQS